MKKLLPVLLLCALLLVGCGKKDAAPEGSGSAGAATEQTTSGKKDSPASKTEKTKASAAPAAESAAPAKESAAAASRAPASSGSSGASETAKPANPTVPDPTPTPKIADWDDAEAAQQQIVDLLSVNPVGNWMDKTTGAMMVIDGDFRGSILLAQKDGSSTVWTFTGTYDPQSGVLSYTDGLRQTVGAGGMKTDYENSAGSLSVKDGNLVWTDAHEKTSITFVRDES